MIIISDCFEFGKDYNPGNDIDVVQSVMSAESCQAKCQTLSACKYWTLNTSNNKCIRKGSKPSSPADVSYAISGPKYCLNGNIY